MKVGDDRIRLLVLTNFPIFVQAENRLFPPTPKLGVARAYGPTINSQGIDPLRLLPKAKTQQFLLTWCKSSDSQEFMKMEKEALLVKKVVYYENCPGCQVDKRKETQTGIPIKDFFFVWIVVFCNCKYY
ncbi:hypothetical protein IFM89_017317 [Coptis chinensis]|uniref:Uncharacterized protein n=1 Tax=Coptis chinensis TaxID=261450 RepID=A0A835LHK4_9MAGN|nr:hypothetical protein IFM89_017317 [Coptis chinensis]